MYRFLFTLLPVLEVKTASYYPRYGESTGYPSSTIANLNNYPLRTGSYGGSDIASFPEVTRYPNYSPSYGYTTSAYPSYSSTRYPFGNGYSTTGYNSLYNGVSSNYNQGLNRYGAGYGTGYGTGSYGSGSYGSGSYGSTGYGSSGYGSTGYGSSGYGSTGYGSNGYGSSSYGSSGYGSSGYGSSGYGVGGYRAGSTAGSYNSYEAPFMSNVGGCVSRSPQSGIFVDDLMGMWYGVEYIQHLGADSHIDYARTCIVIHIAEPRDRPSTENQLFHVQHINAKFRQDFRHLRLLWDEAGHTAEYALYFRNDTAGYWHVTDGQNGTMTNLHTYQQFSGIVQVLKAVNDHLVLNFCQESKNGRPPQLYSVLFSRVPGELDRYDIDAVHNLLQNRKLSTASRRMVCGNGAVREVLSVAISFLTCLLVYVVSS